MPQDSRHGRAAKWIGRGRAPAVLGRSGGRRLQPAAVTARLAITEIRCARYSADAWMSVFSPSGEIFTPLAASGLQLADSAASSSAERKTPSWPAPVTATR